jgi:hypothetical protein
MLEDDRYTWLKRMREKIKLALVCLVTIACNSALAAGNDAAIRFNRDIRPLLTENCFACHGPDPAGRKEGLRFDRAEGFFTERKDGTPVVKGDPQKSLLYQRITSNDSDEIMPPVKSHKTLTGPQKDLIKRWIEQGAPWEAHWSWIVPVKAPLPAVKNPAWVRNPIDQFILAALDGKGLTPAPEADRRTLIRRVTFDIIGLPPTPEEIQAFLDDKSDAAYEHVVDRLLASPRYGEHRARYWLDAARYADTHGLHFDNFVEMWPYRDWVINAYNRNMPFDQFLTEQLAGDLLPNRTMDQQIASGFVRCNETTNEGGTIEEENRVLYARDRTETIGRVCLGLTVGCAVCHDHKFDPILQKDFYSLSAFLNNGTNGGLDGNIKDTPPSIVVPKLEDRPQYAQLTSDADGVREQIERRSKDGRPDYDRWLTVATAAQMQEQLPTRDMQLLAPLSEGSGDVTHAMVNGQSRDVVLAPQARWAPAELTPMAMETQQGVAPTVADVGDFDSQTPYSCAVWAKLPNNATGAIVARMDRAGGYRGWDMYVQADHVGGHLIHHWNDDALKVLSKKAADPDKWHHFCITYDGKGKASGYKVYIDGEAQKTQTENDTLKGTARTTVPLKIGQRDQDSPIVGLLVEDVRVYTRSLDPTEVAQLAKAAKMSTIIRKPPEKRTDSDKKALYAYWLKSVDPQSQAMDAKLDGITRKMKGIESRGAETLVMQEKPTPGVAFVLFRGNYDQRRDQVGPMTPASLPPFPANAPRNRLGLAQWMLEPENPLPARVEVNRLWQEIFGTGIVKTAEDFGIMGEMPSNQELLDWLAVDFRDSHWDIKRMVKLIVMSATYRQAATDTPEKVEIDPENRLLARGPRFRMDAEMLRDEALEASGLLSPTMGGPSVRPYQPAHIWDVVGMAEGNTREYLQDHGDSLYRRSVYTFWKRQGPPPSMEIFNAPTRETCTVRRDRTDTPLQALVTMNDTQFVEAARVLAEKAMATNATTFDTRLDVVTERVLARPFRPEEIAIAQSEYNDLLKYYRAHQDEAVKLLDVGESKRNVSLNPAEHAAWTMLTNQVMNLDEALNK